MSIASKIHPLRHLPTAALLLSLLCACSFYEYEDNTEEADPVTPTEKYINLSIVVSSGNEGTTRADTPKGGEDGDGREAGLERENEVEGVTLMLYQDDKGINTTGEPKIEFINYYPVTRVSQETTAPDIEAIYTTNDQPLGTTIKTDKEYHVIVVANLDLTKKYFIGSSVKTIRDDIANTIYDGTGIGVDAKKFVMSLETDCTINFSKATIERKENKLIYNFDNICIERLAARVDFWMNKATYNGTKEGYEYSVDGSNDIFVLTAVTPFNIYNDEEYLFKRVNAGGEITYLTADKYLESEDIEPYVIDPKTRDKSMTSTISIQYKNTLASLVEIDLDENNTPHTLASAIGFYQQTKTLHESSSQKASFTDDGGKDNFILCYPKENTLMLASPLYNYATGVAIEGDYYKSGETTPTHYIYYGYLRHNGEGYDKETYYSLRTANELNENKEKERVGTNGVPMNFGVVRNNIYRISIEKITEKKEDKDPEMKLQIKVKKWDTFTHSTIYM